MLHDVWWSVYDHRKWLLRIMYVENVACGSVKHISVVYDLALTSLCILARFLFLYTGGLAIFATMALGVNASHLEAYKNSGASLGLLASAIVTLTAIAWEGFDSKDDDHAGKVYGMCLTCFTILVVLALLKLEEQNGAPPAFKLPVLAAFGIMWLTLACLLTFRGPFLTTGNGYFASWAGAVTSLYATMVARESSPTASSSTP